MEDKPLHVLEAIVFRLSNDLKEQKDARQNLIILKCFNIVRTFVEQNNYILSFFGNIEKIISILYEYFDQNEFEFGEDIFGIILSLINKQKCIPPSIMNLLPVFDKIFRRRKGILGTLFQILNSFLIYGDSMFLNNLQNLEIVKFFNFF